LVKSLGNPIASKVAAEALARIAEGIQDKTTIPDLYREAVPALIPLMNSPFQNIRETSFQSLLKLPTSEDQWDQAFRTGLGSSDESWKLQCIRQLGQHPAPSLIPDLAKLQTDASVTIRTETQKTL